MNSSQDVTDKALPYTRCAKGIAFDTCHKIYILLDDTQLALMRDYGYDPLITSEEMDAQQMAAQVAEWYMESCALRFVNAVKTVEGDANEGFIVVIGQGEDSEDEDEDEDEWQDEEDDREES